MRSVLLVTTDNDKASGLYNHIFTASYGRCPKIPTGEHMEGLGVVTFAEPNQEMRTLIRGAERNLQSNKTYASQDNIFEGILRSSLPPHELSTERLKDEAVSIIGAGIASAEWTLTIACFHIIDNPQVQSKLKQELRTAIPDPDNLPPLTELERLPFLMACVEESKLPFPTSVLSLCSS